MLAKENRVPIWFNFVGLVVSLAAAIVVFLPFAMHTSAWEAVTLRVPGDQGNWWHLLIGVPFFLAFPMIWLHLRSLLSSQPPAPAGRRILWTVIGLSACGTILVEIPFLLRLGNLRHMSEWRQLTIVVPPIAVLIACAAVLATQRRNMLPTSACLLGLKCVYLANAALVLVIYGPYTLDFGWYATLVIVSFFALEIVWIFFTSLRTPASPG